VIDTAPVYGFGSSEEIVGKAVTRYGGRDKIIIATKVALEWREGKVFRNSTPERITAEIEDSLRRLQTDYIDLYQVHWPDPLVPIDETAAVVAGLHKAGKIRAIGVSNYSPEQMEIFRKAATLISCQPPYNLFERQIDQDILPYCKEHGIALLHLRSALPRPSQRQDDQRDAIQGDDLRRVDPKFQRPCFDQYLAAVSLLDRLALERHGKGVMELAVRWILDQGIDIALWAGLGIHIRWKRSTK
jgi:aryl-alcohol dehydrogenase-like predicted oxidoreductase